MKTSTLLFLAALLFVFKTGSAEETKVDRHEAFTIAVNFFRSSDYEIALYDDAVELLTYNESLRLAYVFQGDRNGFVVVAADKRLNPVIYYSTSGKYNSTGPLESILRADLAKRLDHYGQFSVEYKQQIAADWQRYSAANVEKRLVQYWPPAGTTSSGGWTETNWSQNYPYNIFCPVHLATGQRTLVGCPATAISQILYYHRDLQQTQFGVTDRYYHNYNQSFWIDDAWETYDFLSFNSINDFLVDIEAKMLDYETLEVEDMAALSLAAAFACRSVFSPSASGTFGVNQAFDAFQKFGFTESVLLDHTYSNDEIRQKMIENIQSANPVLLAVVDANWQSGHNVVCDGYSADGFFRINMGWGGSMNGWYNLPEQFPYNLTVFEGVVADIVSSATNPVTFVVHDEDGFPMQNIMISIENTADSAWTNESGIAIIDLANGTYTYTISVDGYPVENNEFTVVREKLTIDITLIPTYLISLMTPVPVIYPNPAGISFTVSNARGATICVRNTMGMLVVEPTFISEEMKHISIAHLDKGSYIITVVHENGRTFTSKLLKN
ncbi:MAG: C10 family peptidase [Bacteroidales bacterium]|nr:C10 family peptidase [Bacteroidales bacterium]